MASIFTKIIERQIPAHIVDEDKDFIAILDINPLVEGHCLIIPKKEISYIFDLDDHTYTGLNLFAKKIAQAVKKAFPCERIGIAVIGLEVPHVHIHLVPMNSMDDINFNRAKLKPTQEQLKEALNKIEAYL